MNGRRGRLRKPRRASRYKKRKWRDRNCAAGEVRTCLGGSSLCAECSQSSEIDPREKLISAFFKTRSVFDRYNIFSEADLPQATERLQRHLQAQKTMAPAVVLQKSDGTIRSRPKPIWRASIRMPACAISWTSTRSSLLNFAGGLHKEFG